MFRNRFRYESALGLFNDNGAAFDMTGDVSGEYGREDPAVELRILSELRFDEVAAAPPAAAAIIGVLECMELPSYNGFGCVMPPPFTRDAVAAAAGSSLLRCFRRRA